MIATDELNEYLEEYLEEKQEVKNLNQETIKKQTFNISKFINFLEDRGVEELTDSNVKKQLRQYRRHCLKKRENKRTTVKTYMMNILEFINSEDVQEEIQHETIKMKDIIEVKAEDPETAKKRIEKISLTHPQSNYLLQTIEMEGNKRDYAICATFLDSGIRLKELVLLNKDDIQVPIDDKGFYELPSDTNEFIEVYLRAETTKGELKDRTTFITYDTLVSLNDMIYDRITKLRKNTNDVYRPVIQRKKAAEEATREELFLNQKGRLKGNKAGYRVIDEKGEPISEKFTWKKCYEDFKNDVVTYKIFMETAKNELEKLISKAPIDTMGQIHVFDIDETLDTLAA